VALSTTSGGAIASQQEFDAWGKIRSGGVSQTKRNYTGQILDGTGLLFYTARYYDPALGRFISADTVVPGNASGGMEGVAVKPLTVGFHETQFLGKLNGENKLGFWFQLSDEERQQAGSPWGPANPQALNRYAYVQNNPLKYTDPSGHYAIPLVLLPFIAIPVAPMVIGGTIKDEKR
jgi:RHS repeat-associated protein